MHSTLVNLWLFAQVIAKVSLITGLAPGAAVALAMEYGLVYRWNRMGRKGKLCRVLARGKRNSVLVEFEDGFKAVTSGNALRKEVSLVEEKKSREKLFLVP